MDPSAQQAGQQGHVALDDGRDDDGHDHSGTVLQAAYINKCGRGDYSVDDRYDHSSTVLQAVYISKCERVN